MMKSHRFTITAAILLMAAGAAAQPGNQPDKKTQPADRTTQPGINDTRPGAMSLDSHQLIPSEWATGAKVLAKDGARLGKIDDLIVDSGDGRVLYAVLSHGGVLGIGDKLIAVPWRAFTWDHANKDLILDTTKDRLNAAPTFEPNQWNLLGERTWTEKMNNYFNVRRASTSDMWSASGPYQDMVRDGQPVTLHGTVKSMDHSAPLHGGAGGTITVAENDGTIRTVHLGPTHYVESQKNSVKVGDEVDITGVRINYQNQGVIVAKTVKGPQGECRFRDDQGNPLWTGKGDRMTDMNDRDREGKPDMDKPARDTNRASASGQLIKASTIKGEAIRNAQNDKVGKVDDLVFDATSGRSAFVVISFGGFLGINDTLVPLPWDMFQVGTDGKLFAGNITKDQLKNAPRFQKNDWAELKDPAFGPRVYQHYGRQPAWWNQRDDMGAMNDRAPLHDAKGNFGEEHYTKIYNAGAAAEYTGTISQVEYSAPIVGMTDTTLIVIDTDNGARDIHLAPRTFLDQYKLTLKEGDKVTVHGRTATVDGKQVLIATDIRAADGTALTLRNKDGVSIWNTKR